MAEPKHPLEVYRAGMRAALHEGDRTKAIAGAKQALADFQEFAHPHLAMASSKAATEWNSAIAAGAAHIARMYEGMYSWSDDMDPALLVFAATYNETAAGAYSAAGDDRKAQRFADRAQQNIVDAETLRDVGSVEDRNRVNDALLAKRIDMSDINRHASAITIAGGEGAEPTDNRDDNCQRVGPAAATSFVIGQKVRAGEFSKVYPKSEWGDRFLIAYMHVYGPNLVTGSIDKITGFLHDATDGAAGILMYTRPSGKGHVVAAVNDRGRPLCLEAQTNALPTEIVGNDVGGENVSEAVFVVVRDPRDTDYRPNYERLYDELKAVLNSPMLSDLPIEELQARLSKPSFEARRAVRAAVERKVSQLEDGTLPTGDPLGDAVRAARVLNADLAKGRDLNPMQEFAGERSRPGRNEALLYKGAKGRWLVSATVGGHQYSIDPDSGQISFEKPAGRTWSVEGTSFPPVKGAEVIEFPTARHRGVDRGMAG